MGFALIMAFMILGSITSYFLLKSLFVTAPESRIFKLSYELDANFNGECEAGQKYLATRDARDLRMLSVMRERFLETKDSLAEDLTSDEARSALEVVSVTYRTYDEFLRSVDGRARTDSMPLSASEATWKRATEDSLRKQIRRLTLASLPPLYKSMRLREKEISDSTWTPGVIIGLSLLVSIVITWFIARQLTRPLQASAGRNGKSSGRIVRDDPDHRDGRDSRPRTRVQPHERQAQTAR